MKTVFLHSRTVLAVASSIAILGLTAQSSNAKSFAQEHPRRAQVIHRDQQLNNRINNDRGHLNGHYGQLKAEDRGIYRQEQNDARNNGGYITRGQQGQLNREETDLSKQTYFDNNKNSFVQNHPRRAQVLGRAYGDQERINADEGHLNGHYGQLMKEDKGIIGQEQNDARKNGGYITRGQQGQLNREETDLSKQTYFDNNKNSFVQNHPRRAQVLGRAYGDQERINADEGHLNGHYGQLMNEDKSVISQEQNDARKNGGYITAGQQHQLNNEEHDISKQTYFDNNQNSFVKNHPGRAQVLGRAYGLADNINADEGKLGGHYGQLRSEDQSIMHQEQADAAADHGHITGSERAQLNQEESSLKNQIQQDFQ